MPAKALASAHFYVYAFPTFLTFNSIYYPIFSGLPRSGTVHQVSACGKNRRGMGQLSALRFRISAAIRHCNHKCRRDTQTAYNFLMAKPVYPHPDKLELYEKLVATNPKVQLKGAGVPNTILNGHMFSYLTKDGKLALRLPEGMREEFLKKYRANLCAAYGKIQPEYVEVPDAILAKTSELRKYFDTSFGYVSSLKPKKTK